ncbi:unnamed protein product [Vitrella brassicaformis CCMP3155]|uniref:ShKT domain-containing protein n=2 Tax=Vitrella brassicaformis TaxID=1169539 RepID=A0A0G4ER47_VITBC|nr:unnamed protein product [Vitrella brassicaformis CCMP3155]|eukprot:CEL99954.1 unnamed protein product [Vitrella brassicaformis CCMP3155]
MLLGAVCVLTSLAALCEAKAAADRQLQRGTSCTMACPSFYMNDNVCDRQCAVNGCAEDTADCGVDGESGDCPDGSFFNPQLFQCRDSPKVRQQGKTCRMLTWAANRKGMGCTVRLTDLARAYRRGVPAEVHACTRLMDVCAASCNACSRRLLLSMSGGDDDNTGLAADVDVDLSWADFADEGFGEE